MFAEPLVKVHDLLQVIAVAGYEFVAPAIEIHAVLASAAFWDKRLL